MVYDDSEIEPDETFTLTLTNPTGATLGDATATATIKNDDTAATLTASDVGDTTVDLTISGHTGNWWYKGNVHQCTAVPAGTTTIGLSGLSAATAYEYKAYSESTCKTTLDGVEFRTLAPVGTPTVSVSDVQGDEDDSWMTFEVSLSAASREQVTVGYATSSGTATSGTDFRAASGTLTIPANSTQPANVSVLVYDDSEIESDETFTLTLTNPTGATLGDATATGTINDDDTRAALTATLAASDVGETTAKLTIGGHTGNWWYKGNVHQCTAVSAGTPTVGLSGLSEAGGYEFEAYSESTCTTVLATGVEFVTLWLKVISLKPTEARLTLFNYNDRSGWWYKGDQSGAACTSVTGAGASITGLNAETTYTYRAYAAAGCNTADELGSETFQTPATGNTTLSVSDITQTTSTLTIAGHTGTWWYDGNGHMACTTVTSGATLALSGLLAGVWQNYSAYDRAGCDRADEIARESWFTERPVVGMSQAKGVEGKAVEFTVSLSAATDKEVTVDYATSSRTAESGMDFRAASGTLSFAAHTKSATVRVATTDDSADEGDETFTLELSNPVGARLRDAVAVGTIEDDDESTASLTAAFDGVPVKHDGKKLFAFHIRFSEEFEGLRLTALKDGALAVTGGRLVDVKRTVRGQNRSVTVRVRPTTSGDVSVSMVAATDCSAAAAICTADGRALSNLLSATVPGPMGALLTQDKTPPRIYSAITAGFRPVFGADGDYLGNRWILWTSWNEPLDVDSIPATGDFAVEVDGDLWAVEEVKVQSGPNANYVMLYMPPELYQDQVVTFSYAAGTNPIQDIAGNAAPSFTDRAVVVKDVAHRRPVTGVPDADAGDNVWADPGASVTLDGSGSSDPDGDTLTFDWGQIPPVGVVTQGQGGPIVPQLGMVALTGTDTARPTFVAPAEPGLLSFLLTVADPSGRADRDAVIVQVRDLAPDFGDATVGAMTLTPGEAMEPLVLPEATGGNGELTYVLTSEPAGLAGLSFDPASRTISGTPTTNGSWTVAYAAVDADSVVGNGDKARLTFKIHVWDSSTQAVPNPATGVTASNATQTAVDLAWTLPAQPSGIVVSAVEVQRQEADGSWGTEAALAADAASHTVTGLSAGTSYSFRVRVATNGGDSDSESVSAATLPDFTASFHGLPEAHDGSRLFEFEIRFSEEFQGLRLAALKEGALTVTGGRLVDTKRTVRGQNRSVTARVRPSQSGAVTLTLAATSDCAATAAICTRAGKKFRPAVSATVPGPAANAPEAALPVLSVADARAEEGGTLSFAVTLSALAAGAVTVDYTTADGTTASGVDYTAASGTLTFAAGETAKTVEVATLADSSAEDDETLTLTLSNASGATIGTAAATGTVADVAPLPVLGVANARTDEGGNLEFRVTLSAAAVGEVTVDYATSDGTATAGTDYTAASGTLAFAAGETEKTVSVAVLHDGSAEADETLTLTLSNASGANIGDGEATGTAVDVAPLTASFHGLPGAHDGRRLFEFEIRFSEEFQGLRLTALEAGALQVTNGRVVGVRRTTRGQNRSVTVKVRPSSTDDLTLTLPATTDCAAATAICTSEGRKLSGTATATVQGPVAVSVADAEAREGTDVAVEFAVTLSRAASGTVTVNYATRDGTAKAGEDYTATRGTLSFAAGELEKTVSVPILDDALDEGKETFTLKLTSVRGAAIADDEATGTIENSDPLQTMWLSRFGRTVADHVAGAVSDRLSNPMTGMQVTVGGQSLDLAQMEDEAWLDRTMVSMARVLGVPDRSGTRDDGWPDTGLGMHESPTFGSAPVRSVTGREILLGSSFHLTGDGGGTDSG